MAGTSKQSGVTSPKSKESTNPYLPENKIADKARKIDI